MAAKLATTYDDIVRDVKAGSIAPVYVLMGEEGYYIDKLEALITQSVMPESNRDFDMELLYGGDVDALRVADSCRQYPMLGDKRLVVVREFQQMKSPQDALAAYVKHPSPTTVLVVCCKNGSIDRRKGLGKALSGNAVVFESKKVYDTALPGFIRGYVKAAKKEVDEQAIQMLVEHVGANLSRMSGELDKLLIALPEGESRVTAALVEAQTGVSKEFNNFELIAALSRKSKPQVLKIVKYYNSNPRSFALQPTLSMMFSFFADVMLAFYSPEKSERGIAQWLGQPDWKVKREILPAMKCYTGRQVMNILAWIRECDGASKGVGGCKSQPGELLLELVCRILQ